MPGGADLEPQFYDRWPYTITDIRERDSTSYPLRNILAEAQRFVVDVAAGVVKTNDKTTGLELHVPFGGLKNSSSETWREQGDAGTDFYTIERTVYDNF